jgi:hypothetical protein
MDRYTELDTVRDRVWQRMERAADDSRAPFRILTFGTIQGDRPQLRSVVLRGAAREARRLSFHSDRRAEKIDDIRAHDRIAWHGWDPDTSEQIRLWGMATVHTDDAVADEMWAAEDPSALALYPKPPAPGTPLDAPDDGLPASVAEEPITRADVADGRQYFAVVRTVIDAFDWLHLHPEGHYRARFRLDSGQEAFEGRWIVP